MAVVYSTYTKVRGKAKANIRYIQHRAGKDGERLTRTLFGHDGPITRPKAYSMIDTAARNTYFYRISFNPDLKREDTKSDLDLQHLTRETIRLFEKRFGRPIEFVAAVHADHTERRHVNLLAFLPQRLSKRDLNTLRQILTMEARLQRRELDRELGAHWEETRQLSRNLPYHLKRRLLRYRQTSRQVAATGGGGRIRKSAFTKTYACPFCGREDCDLHKRGKPFLLERKRAHD